MHREKRIIEREIISGARLVATTLTQLTLRPSITHAEFDHVIIDEAAAAQLPHLAHAVGYARTGAVLVGDYLQNGPIVEKSFPGGKEVRELFETDCFSFFDAIDPVRVSTGPAHRRVRCAHRAVPVRARANRAGQSRRLPRNPDHSRTR